MNEAIYYIIIVISMCIITAAWMYVVIKDRNYKIVEAVSIGTIIWWILIFALTIYQINLSSN